MKRITLILLLSAFAFTACAKTKTSNKQGQTSQQITNAKTQTQEPELSPELVKLNKVLTKMSQRCLEEIPNGNPQEFLDDLKAVLNAEADYNPADVSLYYLIDKKHNIGSTYIPQNLIKLQKNNDFAINRNDLSLRSEAYEALVTMSKAAKEDGITLLVSSTYRSYEYQQKLFQRWVDIDGLEEAERESARAGTSQHQLGTAIDFGSITDDFAQTKMGQWIYKNAATYGWSLSFPMGYEDITGYRWECWHFRYIGKEACNFQAKWFNNVQQDMLEFINAWKNFQE